MYGQMEDKIEISVTGGGEDSMQLNTATSGLPEWNFSICDICMKVFTSWMPMARLFLGQAASVEAER